MGARRKSKTRALVVTIRPAMSRAQSSRPDAGERVTFTFDGDPIVAERGEPVASAIVASGRLSIARSPKFHRPRGPSCFRAACDGCLARVDGVPNVMTCRVPAREGMTVESQNTLGSRNVDLLRLTDWFFPDGMNHHELFAGVVGLQKVMQIFARRIAGLGKLPHEALPARSASRREADVVVVGGGPSGLEVASRLADRGRAPLLVDDGCALGGSAFALGSPQFSATFERFASARGRVEVFAESTVVGTFGDDLLLVTPTETLVVQARDVVLATGAHDGVLAFDGNDLPGVMSARAACLMLRYGAVPGKKVAVVVSEGGGPFGEAYASALGEKDVAVTVVHGEPESARGTSRVKGVVVKSSGRKKELACDALIVDAPRAPSFELALQLGAALAHEPRGYVVEAENGRIKEGVWGVGELVGTPLEAGAIAREAEGVAARLAG